MRARKPDPRTAMGLLIGQIRSHFPFDLPPDKLCDGPCTGCPKKLLEYLDTEVTEWEDQLARGAEPTLGDLGRLARKAHKIHAVLKRNGLVSD